MSENEYVDEKTIKKAIDYIALAPIVLHPGWMDVPEKIKKRILPERVAHAIEIIKEEKATELEALAYICSASMCFPLDRYFYNIYKHLFCKYFPDLVPKVFKNDDAPVELTDYEKHLLDKLRSDIFKTQMKVIKEKKTRNARKGQTYLTAYFEL